ETVERVLSGGAPAESLARLYEKAWRERFSSRFHWSARLRTLMLSPAAGALALRLFGERLVRFGFAATRGATVLSRPPERRGRRRASPACNPGTPGASRLADLSRAGPGSPSPTRSCARPSSRTS